MKKRCFAPFITQLFLAVFIMGVILLFLPLSKMLKVSIGYGSIGITLTIAACCLYCFSWILPFYNCFLALIDLISNKSVTCKMTYINSISTYNRIVPCRRYDFGHEAKKIDGSMKRTELADCYHMKLIFYDHKGKSFFYTTFLHGMESGKSYTITYGKNSRILLSALTDEGAEMLRIQTSDN